MITNIKNVIESHATLDKIGFSYGSGVFFSLWLLQFAIVTISIKMKAPNKQQIVPSK